GLVRSAVVRRRSPPAPSPPLAVGRFPASDLRRIFDRFDHGGGLGAGRVAGRPAARSPRCFRGMPPGSHRIANSEGRIPRPGNENAEAAVYPCVTEGSFDAYKWQALETKARFIS